LAAAGASAHHGASEKGRQVSAPSAQCQQREGSTALAKHVRIQRPGESYNQGRARASGTFGRRRLETCHTDKRPQLIEEQPQSEYEKKKANFITRTIWTLVMIGGFFWALGAGHVFIMIAVTAVQVISFKEVIAIANVPSKARSLRFTKSLNWYFLGIAMYFLYGESVIYYFKHILMVDRLLLPLATHHRFISFMLYIIGMSTLYRVHLSYTHTLMR